MLALRPEKPSTLCFFRFSPVQYYPNLRSSADFFKSMPKLLILGIKIWAKAPSKTQKSKCSNSKTDYTNRKSSENRAK